MAIPRVSGSGFRRTLVVVGAVTLVWTGCGGGGSSPSSPSPTPTPSVPTSSACSAVGTAIVNGTECSTATSPVLLLDLRDQDGFALGSCSGTIIASRAVLTAAHCLDAAGSVRIFFGTGAEVTARSFAAYPGFHEGDPTALDVGVVLMTDDLGRAAVPLLLSRDARVGETAVIAGWGKDQNQLAATLRAGSTTISAIGGTQLQTVASTNGSAVCSGDSGGPLLLLEGGVWSIAGITSAVTSTACTFGTNFFANVRNPSITSFILSQVPDAARR